MNFYVVDTNVARVASGHAKHAGPDCIIACIDILRSIVRDGGIVLDDAMRILKEYRAGLNWSGQPGVGDEFFKWVWDHQADESRCERVTLNPRPGPGSDFLEFPDDADLARFHADDRKFVAVALTSRHDPEVLNAVDRDWWEHRQVLARNGVRIKFLCPDEMKSG